MLSHVLWVASLQTPAGSARPDHIANLTTDNRRVDRESVCWYCTAISVRIVLQKEFLSGSQRPAAEATRVTPKRPPALPTTTLSSPPKEAPADHAEPRQGKASSINSCCSTEYMHAILCKSHIFNTNATSLFAMQGLLPGMLGILTDVQEKPVNGQVSAPIPPTGGAAFPKATHRKQSKVCQSACCSSSHAAQCAYASAVTSRRRVT